MHFGSPLNHLSVHPFYDVSMHVDFFPNILFEIEFGTEKIFVINIKSTLSLNLYK